MSGAIYSGDRQYQWKFLRLTILIYIILCMLFSSFDHCTIFVLYSQLFLDDISGIQFRKCDSRNIPSAARTIAPDPFVYMYYFVLLLILLGIDFIIDCVAVLYMKYIYLKSSYPFVLDLPGGFTDFRRKH